MKTAATREAGFIGSRMAERLLKEHGVPIINNFSLGSREKVPERAEVVKHGMKESWRCQRDFPL